MFLIEQKPNVKTGEDTNNKSVHLMPVLLQSALDEGDVGK